MTSLEGELSELVELVIRAEFESALEFGFVG